MQIYRSVRRASLLRHISFGGRALGMCTLVKVLPELKPIIEHFGAKSISQWRNNMELDRKIVERSVRLGLFSWLAAERLFGTLDDYMLEMHAAKISTVLESLKSFAHRITPVIQKDLNAPCWWINSQILVHRRHWFELSRRVAALASNIIDCLEEKSRRNQSNLPGEVKLRDMARETAIMYRVH